MRAYGWKFECTHLLRLHIHTICDLVRTIFFVVRKSYVFPHGNIVHQLYYIESSVLCEWNMNAKPGRKGKKEVEEESSEKQKEKGEERWYCEWIKKDFRGKRKEQKACINPSVDHFLHV